MKPTHEPVRVVPMELDHAWSTCPSPAAGSFVPAAVATTLSMVAIFAAIATGRGPLATTGIFCMMLATGLISRTMQRRQASRHARCPRARDLGSKLADERAIVTERLLSSRAR